MYCVMNFNVFVCSACAGIHREMNHKVKGISMCVFSEQELKELTENGNAVSTSSANLTLNRFAPEPAGQADENLEGKEQPDSRQIRCEQNERVLQDQIR